MNRERGGEDRWSIDSHSRVPAQLSSATAPAAPSPDNTDAVYARLREQLALRTRLPVHQRRVERARAIVREGMAHGPAIVLFSGGKDSTALLHLCREMCPELPSVFVDDGAQLPWTYQTIDRIRAMGHAVQVIETVVSFPWMLKRVGMLGSSAPERLEGAWHWSPSQFREVLVEEPARRIRDMGYPVHLMGLRAEESRARLMNRKRRGVIYGRGNGITVVCPLADWDGIDVLAYCVTHDLPLSPAYLQPDDSDRYRRRTAAVYLEQSAEAGDWQRIREQLPAFWQEMTAEFPGMRKRT